jgi:hypothetical protein
MDRRKSLKALFLFASVGVSSFSFYRWFSRAEMPDMSLLEAKKEYVAQLADLIIPRTDTPGAKDAKVEIFIINNIKFCSDFKTQNSFVHGITDLEKYARDKYSLDFLRCNEFQQLEILSHFEKKSLYSYSILNKISNKVLGPPFFSKLKSLTVEGYCTSMMGATQGLVYDYIPGTYIGCIPLTKNQKSWATK